MGGCGGESALVALRMYLGCQRGVDREHPGSAGQPSRSHNDVIVDSWQSQCPQMPAAVLNEALTLDGRDGWICKTVLTNWEGFSSIISLWIMNLVVVYIWAVYESGRR
jgi:hypothetical protein